MRRFEYDDLYFRSHENDNTTVVPNLTPNSGKHKGKITQFLSANYNQVAVKIDGMDTKFPYAKLEFLDEDGNIVIAPVTDMTGREVKAGDVICYSRATGRNSHALEIGRIKKISPSGSVSTTPIVCNGEVIPKENHYRYFNSRDKNLDSQRTLLLPVADAMVTFWVLTNFEHFKADSM